MKKLSFLFFVIFLISTFSLALEKEKIIEKKITLSDIERLADKGNPDALNILSWIYFNGNKEFKIEKNNEKGIYYMTKAAEKNQVNSMTDLGWFSFTGEYGVKKDFKKGNGGDWVKVYLENIDRVNNWDLVDASAPYILGPWLENKDRKLLYQFAKSKIGRAHV